jgi:hypothetical protein
MRHQIKGPIQRGYRGPVDDAKPNCLIVGVARVDFTPGGPNLWLCSILVRSWVGKEHDAEAIKLAEQLGFAIEKEKDGATSQLRRQFGGVVIGWPLSSHAG